MQAIFTITGYVKRNLGRGSELGYPTANIDYSGDLEDGVYLSYVSFEDQTKLPSLSFIGAPETFNDSIRRLEVYILDFTGDLYDKQITVSLLKKTRGNMKFDNTETLIAQMKEDETNARKFFSQQL